MTKVKYIRLDKTVNKILRMEPASHEWIEE